LLCHTCPATAGDSKRRFQRVDQRLSVAETI
jgi:hypothetical protein